MPTTTSGRTTRALASTRGASPSRGGPPRARRYGSTAPAASQRAPTRRAQHHPEFRVVSYVSAAEKQVPFAKVSDEFHDQEDCCAICLIEPRAIRLRPCGHAAACAHCMLRMITSTSHQNGAAQAFECHCPLCKHHIAHVEWSDAPPSAPAAAAADAVSLSSTACHVATRSEASDTCEDDVSDCAASATGSSTPPGLRRLSTFDCTIGSPLMTLEAFVDAAACDSRSPELQTRARELIAASKMEDWVRSINLGHVDGVRRLIESFQYPCDVVDDEGWSPVYRAAHFDHYDIVVLLYEHGADPCQENAVTSERGHAGRQPIHTAAANGHVEILRWLLAHNARLTDRTKNGNTPLHLACQHGQWKTVDVLREAYEAHGITSLWQAALSDVNLIGEQPVHLAAMGASECEEGFDVSHLRANEWRYFRTLKLLLDAGAEVNADSAPCGKTPLIAACAAAFSCQSDVLNDDGSTVVSPLLRRAMVDLLLDRGASVESTLTEGKFAGSTALMMTVLTTGLFQRTGRDQQSVYVPLAQLLLRHGADVNRACPTLLNATPLIIACEHECADMARLLLREGASVNAQRMDGARALHIAVDRRTSPLGIVRLLLESGAEADCTAWDDHPASTPLLCAIRAHNVEMVELLLEHGASVDYAPCSGTTPLRAARHEDYEHGHLTNACSRIHSLLKDYGALDVSPRPLGRQESRLRDRARPIYGLALDVDSTLHNRRLRRELSRPGHRAESHRT